jgi:indole-3-glycerol phosphate synthase
MTTKSSKLYEIVAHKRQEVKRLEEHAKDLRKNALLRNEFRGFKRRLFKPGEITLIAEVKKASPSAGVIAEDFDPVQQARVYGAAGAHAISVLTDEKFFQGSLLDMKQVREQVELPVLRKDFIVSPLQVYEASVAGADAILLIVAALEKGELKDLHNLASDLQLDVLVEVHDLKEMDQAVDIGAEIIGINNRDLHTFEIHLETTLKLAEEIPSECLAVSESGIKTREDVKLLRDAGMNCILVGETLMRSKDIHSKIHELLS